jgi:3-oxoacyl-[acyl-carrier protein] reductase
MDLGLTDRVYVVTGGSRGLGLATSQALVAEGARVVLGGRNEESLTAAADAMGGADHAMPVVVDLAEPGGEAQLVAAAMGRWNRLDGALISVGGPPPGLASTLTDDAWRTGFETVFLGAMRVARAVISTLPDSGGSIVFVLSSSVKQPIDGLAVSNGLRPGLAMAAKTLADELGPRNIRVIGLMPGRIDTDRTRELDAASGKADRSRRDNEAKIPLRRYGEPEEFARVATFLLSPAASYMTGTMVAVDGGMIRTL